ncbi:MAG TPA: SDR family NAD(P)-dependent oxidoreductase, partial [Methylotenera sp.]|nr:SDR family NAD(P)-dependent oxidoreductase [Methylotenera sp.]
MDLKLNGKLALVTGSTAGIGHAIASALAQEGAKVIINGRTQSAVDKVVSEIKTSTSGEVVGFAGDLSTADAADALFKQYPTVEIL